MVYGSVVEIGFMLQAHEFWDVRHGGCIKILARGKESKVMLLAIGTEVPFLHFIV